jgi:hypothetical protein
MGGLVGGLLGGLLFDPINRFLIPSAEQGDMMRLRPVFDLACPLESLSL